MHCLFNNWKFILSAPWTDSFWDPSDGITLFLFSVVMCICFCKYFSQQSLSSELCQLFIWTSCLSVCHTDVSVLVHLQNLTQFSCGKMENTCSILPASYCLMERLKPIQTKFTLFSSELVDGETTRGELLAQLCHQITLSLISPALLLCLSLPSWVCPVLSVTFLMAHCCLSSHECDMKSWPIFIYIAFKCKEMHV